MKLAGAGKDSTASFGSTLFLVETGLQVGSLQPWSCHRSIPLAHPWTVLPRVRGQSRCRACWFAGNLQVPARTHRMLSVFGSSWQRWWPGPEQ